MDENLVTIATENFASAQILQTYLESNGIECFLSNVNMVQPNISEGVKVQIRGSDAEKAIKLLAQKNTKEEQKKLTTPRKILVPIDFSLPSQNAARYALLLASKYGSEIKLLHIFNSPMVDMIPFTDAASVQIDIDLNYNIIYKAAKENLIKFYNELKEFAEQTGLGNIKIGYSLAEGYAAYGIIEMSKRYNPGIIIMGTKGQGFRSTELVGSVATEVSAETHLPLLVIPEAAVLKGVDEAKNILYATTFDETDLLAIRKLISIISPFDNVNIHCLHISSNPENALVKAKMTNIKGYFQSINPKVKVECVINKGKDVESEFIKYIHEKRINLVALTHLKRSMIYKIFNPSLCKRMLYDSDVPVLLFPG